MLRVTYIALFLLLQTSTAWSGSVSLSLVESLTTVDVQVTGTCIRNPNQHYAGMLSLKYSGFAAYGGSICTFHALNVQHSGKYEKATMGNGLNTFTAALNDITGTVTDSKSVQIDNTPIISFSGLPQTISNGPTSLNGSVAFTPRASSQPLSGTVCYSIITERGAYYLQNVCMNAPSSGLFDLASLAGFGSQSMAEGNYTLILNATAANGSSAPQIRAPFTINRSPSITLTLDKTSVTGCESASGQVAVTSRGPVANGGVVILSLPDGTARQASFTGTSATLSFADFGLPYGYPVSSQKTTAIKFSVSVTTSSGKMATHSAAASVLPCADVNLESRDSDSDFCTLKSLQVSAQPVQISTGDKLLSEIDLRINKLLIKRTYHSQSTHDGNIGYGWTWTYGWHLTPPAAGVIDMRRPGGKLMSFQDDGTGVYRRLYERTDETVAASTTGWRYTRHDRTTVDFDSAGNVVAIAHEGRAATTVQYDAAGNPVSVTGSHGRMLSIAMDGAGHIASITGPTGRIWSYAYDANNNLASVTYPDGSSRQYVYGDTNDVHNLTQIIDEAGRVYKRVSYDVQDRVLTSEVPLSGYRDTFVYNTDGTVDVTDSSGAIRHYTVTTVNGIPSVDSVSGGACTCGTATAFAIDPVTGFLTSDTDKNGVGNSYTYDANGRLLTKTEAVGTAVQRTTGYTYDAVGHMISMTDATGGVTNYTYDAAGHLLTMTDPLGNTVSNVWNANGTLASRTDANGNATSYAYDTFGQVGSIAYPDGSSRGISYDSASRITAVTDETGSTTTYAYDARDRVVLISYPDGTSVSNTYDVASNLVSQSDAAGLITTYTYDVEHRPLTMTRPDGSVVTSNFDAKGNLTASNVKDATGVTALIESMAYDADGRLLSTTHADNTSVSNTYDMLGRLLTSTDEAGKVSTHSYDERGRLISVSNANGEIATYGYDALDRLILATAPNGVTTTFAFDAAGRLVQEASSDRGYIDYIYDAVGNLTSKTDANGITTNYTYDNRNRMKAITYPRIAVAMSALPMMRQEGSQA